MNRPGGVLLARQLFSTGAQPVLQVVEQRLGLRASHAQAFIGRFATNLGLNHVQFRDAPQ